MESNRVALKTIALATAGVVGIEALARWGIGQWGLAPLTGTALSRLIDIAWMALILSGCPQGWTHIGLGRPCDSSIRARPHARRTQRCFSWSAVSSARLQKRFFSGAWSTAISGAGDYGRHLP